MDPDTTPDPKTSSPWSPPSAGGNSPAARTNKRPLLIIFLVIFIDLLGFGMVLPLLPRYGAELQADDWIIGLLMASFSAMQFIFSPIWGRVSDRVGRRPILLMGLAGSVVFYGLFGYASAVKSLALMFIARIGAGIAGATISTAQAYIADVTPPERRTAGMALIGAAFGLGFTLGPLLGLAAVLMPTTNGAAPEIVTSAVVAAPSPALPETPVVASDLNPAPGYLAAGISGVALLLAIFILPESLAPGAKAPPRHWFDRRNFKTALSTPAIGSLLVVFFIATFAFAQFESTLSLLTKRAFEAAEGRNYALFAYLGLTLTFAQGFLVRRLSKKHGDEMLGILGSGCEVVGMLGLIAAAQFESWTLLLITLPLLVTGFALLTTSVQSMISRRSRADQQGGMLGLNQSGSALARILGPSLGIGSLHYHVSLPYWSSAALLLVVLVLILRLPPAADVPNEAPLAGV